MKNILPVLLVLLLTATPAQADKQVAPTKSEAWSTCLADSDCVQVGTGCFRTAVNKLYQSEANRYYNILKPSNACPTPAVHPKCVAGPSPCEAPEGTPADSSCAVKTCQLVAD